MPGLLKILSIDGGGARGLIPATLLHVIEKRCSEISGRPRRIHELFDVIAGTSTGAVVTLMLTRPDPIPCERLKELYAEHAKDFFYASFWHRLKTLGGWLGPKYPASSPARTLQRFLGTEAELKDAVAEVVIPIYDVMKDSPDPSKRAGTRTFTRSKARKDPKHNFRMWEVAQAATSAPTYFPSVPIRSLGGDDPHEFHPVDGAVYLNNPSGEAMAHALQIAQDMHGGLPEGTGKLVVSVGTGWHARPIVPKRAANWGKLGWVSPLFDVMIEAQAEATAMVLHHIVGIGFVRLQPVLQQTVELDDTSAKAEMIMRDTCDRYLQDKSNQDQIERVCRALCGQDAAAVIRQ